MKLHLRHLLAAAFIVVATLPLLIFGTWVTKTFVEEELADVSEKHLLLARNVTQALDRYALDAEASFGFFSDSLAAGNASQAEIELAGRMGFRHVCIVTNDGKVISFLSVGDDVPGRIPVEIMDKLRPQFAENKTVFSNVMADPKKRATIYLTRRLGPDRIAIGALSLDYIRELQKAISFGERGHSAIVDKAGNVLAHPKPEWQDQLKNISNIKPVAKMMAGETGVATFYSPAMKSEMISGFTTVPRTGWGVMVPQPLSEFERHVAETERAAFFLIILSLFIAGALSWSLSGLLVRPVEAVVNAARQIEDGNLEARVPVEKGFGPWEFNELGKAFNAMARDIGAAMIQRERIEDELERRVEERTRELTEEITERKQAEESMRRSEERLRGAIESLQEGFALFDADDRLVAVNEEYLRISPGAQKVLDAGGTFEDVLRANVATGNVGDAEGREEAFIRERIRQHLDPQGQILRRFTDGSWFIINEARTPEGGIALSFIDVTEIKQAEEALRETQQRFRDFAEIASDWFWEMDKDLRFSYISGRNFEVTGFKPEEVIGKTRREITHEDVLDEKWRRHLDDLDAHRPFDDFCYDLAAPGGKTVCISISGKPIFDNDGNFQGYRGTGTDISARVMGEAALREAKEEAEFANRAKTEFLANMSHELRTPLNSVIGFSDILKEETLGILENPKYKEYATDINDSGKHLLNLINDILDVSRIERGILDLNEKNLDMPLLVGSCKRLVNDRAFKAGLKFSIDVAKGLPAFFADELRCKQIILNLLSNAIKFTPKGGSVILKVEVDPKNRFLITVKDTGIGIAPEDIGTALSDFGQVDGALTRRYEGSGLGLPLSKKLVEAHGGELFIESEPGVGTTVTILFPKERTVMEPSLAS